MKYHGKQKIQHPEQSLPSRERGLKFPFPFGLAIVRAVAPLAGAWIEILLREEPQKFVDVAPLAGAWIEIEGYPEGPEP